MRPFLALLVLLVAGSGCSSRERSNPFDPGNPSTRGHPIAFAALAGDGYATLTWQAVSGSGLVGYQAFRRAEGESSFRAISDVIPPQLTRFTDFRLANGTDYHYQLYYVLSSGVGGRPAEDVATPGPLRPWVTDLRAHRLLNLTPDARHVAFRDEAFAGPTQVDVDRATGVVWACDPDGNRVVIYEPRADVRRVVDNLGAPSAVAADPSTGTAWVCLEGENRVVHLDENGDPAFPGQIAPLLDPVAVAVDPSAGGLWVCEGTGRAVRRFSAGGAAMWSVEVAQPSRVAVDSLTGEGWVTSFRSRNVTRISPDGRAIDTLTGFAGPIGIAVDSRRGRIWVADPSADVLVALHLDGSVEHRLQGLPEVREVAVDLATGEAWATVPGARAVVRVSSAGTILRELFGFDEPEDIALDPGRPVR